MKFIYPGSFDPITLGHLDIINKIASITDIGTEVSILVMNNEKKDSMFTLSARIDMVTDAISMHMPSFNVESFAGNINDYIKSQSLPVIIVRGLRNNTDFDYEITYETFTRRFNAQTIYMTPNPENIFISSSLVRNLILTGEDYTDLVPWK